MAAETTAEDSIGLTQEFLAKAIEAMSTGKATLKDFRGIDDAQMEAIYAMGYNFYQAGRNADAQKVFHVLAVLNNLEPKYWVGLGATFHEDENWEKASLCYQMAIILDFKDPQPAYCLAECYAKLGEREKVAGCIEVLQKLTDHAKSDYLEKARRLLDGMKEA